MKFLSKTRVDVTGKSQGGLTTSRSYTAAVITCLLCRFCAVKNTGRSWCGVLVGAGCEHYKLDCSIGNITCSDDTKNLVKRYYPSGESWMVDWEVYTTIGNIIQDNGRGQSWEVRNSGGADGDGSSIEMDIIKNYFYTYYYWWSADDYNTFIQTCSKIIV